MWQAVLAGLRQLRADNVRQVVNAKQKPELREQACGVINFIDVIMGLETEIEAFHKMLAEPQGDK